MKVLAKNKRASFDYEIEDRMVAGIVLTGAEVKSVKAGHVSLKGSYVILKSGEAFLVNAHINPYDKAAGQDTYDPIRDRKLLLHRSEIDRLAATKQSGVSAVPLVVGTERGFIKLEIGIGRGRKKHDKRQVIKKREVEREARRITG